MQTETLATITSKELESAFAPYPKFIETILQELGVLDQILIENAKRAAEAPKPEPIIQIQRVVEPAPAPVIQKQDDSAMWNAKIAEIETRAQAKVQESQSQVQAAQSKFQESQSEVVRLQAALRGLEDELARTKSEVKLLRSNLAAAEAEADEAEERSMPAPRRTPRVSSQSSVKLSDKKILLVDDAEINRVLMSHYFKGLPIKLDFASTVELAAEKCKLESFDLVVIDFDSNGEMVAKELRTQGIQARLFALSPNSFSEAEKANAMSAGFNHYFSRGLSRDELVQELKNSLWA